MTTLSIIIPAYNEEATLLSLLELVNNVNLINNISKEIIIVDDGSTDSTRSILSKLNPNKYKVVFHEKNSGKGRAIRTGLEHATGDYVIIQDADLEYDPQDYNLLLEKLNDSNAQVVYGSRLLKKQTNKYSGLSFYLGGIFLTKLTNLLYKTNITDEPTCYKLFKTDLIKSLPLKCERFEFCPEVTALITKKGIKIHEVGISYHPRSLTEGKKINWRDGLEAIHVLVKHRFKK